MTGVPAPAPGTGTLVGNLVLFGRLLRDAGVGVGARQIVALARALRFVEIGDRRQVKDAARAVLVGRRSEIAVFDRLFDLFWRPASEDSEAGLPAPELAPPPPPDLEAIRLASPAGEPPPAEAWEDDELQPSLRVYSREELLRQKEFAELTPEERAEVRRLMDELVFRVARRRTRRTVAARKGTALDLRRTLRHSMRFGGEPLRLGRRRRKWKERPLVVLCDVSASMEIYSRLLLRFLWAAGRSSRRFEAFLFGTRLTRITRQLRGREIDRALAEVASSVGDWGGGTRIGASLRAFHYEWGRRVLGQGAVVILISDGWDCGEIDLLEREMARLHRSCDRLIWLNPLLGSPGYEPLTRGMQVALGHLDDFLPVHNLASLEQLGEVLATLGERQRAPATRIKS